MENRVYQLLISYSAALGILFLIYFIVVFKNNYAKVQAEAPPSKLESYLEKAIILIFSTGIYRILLDFFKPGFR